MLQGVGSELHCPRTIEVSAKYMLEGIERTGCKERSGCHSIPSAPSSPVLHSTSLQPQNPSESAPRHKPIGPRRDFQFKAVVALKLDGTLKSSSPCHNYAMVLSVGTTTAANTIHHEPQINLRIYIHTHSLFSLSVYIYIYTYIHINLHRQICR